MFHRKLYCASKDVSTGFFHVNNTSLGSKINKRFAARSKKPLLTIQEQRKLLAQITSDFKNPEDFYTLSTQDIKNRGGGILLDYYKHTYDMLSALHPEIKLLPWKFYRVPASYWKSINNQKTFVEWAASQLHIKSLDDWYNVNGKDLEKIGGDSLLITYYNHSTYNLLSTIYPEYPWLPWRFSRCPREYLDDIQNQRKFLDWVAKQHNINKFEDWYNMTAEVLLKQYNASFLVRIYQRDMNKMMTKVYPEFSWESVKWASHKQKYWEKLLQEENGRKALVDYFEKELGIEKEEDWKDVETRQIEQLNKPFGWGLPQILSLVQKVKKSNKTIRSNARSHRNSQHLLKAMVTSLFPNEDILEEFKFNSSIELDLYFPKLNLAFEYQGQQHYSALNHFHLPLSIDEKKILDTTKVEQCKEHGITLIPIPYWWDKRFDTLVATVKAYRPDLFSGTPIANPIPASAPKVTTVIARERKVMSATVWNKEDDPTGWWMSEKYDGMRLFWDGNKFFTRQGRKIYIPESITSQMPKNIALDGELWTQYGLYQQAVSLANTARSDHTGWKTAIFWVFDAPQSQKTYEERIDFLKERDNTFPSFIKIVETVKCKGKQHLEEFLAQVIAKGGEGVMLRRPQSLYSGGRSSDMRKYKETLDAEVKVLENNYPHGLQCLQINGKEVYVNIMENYKEAKKLKKDDVVTVKYLGTNVHGTMQFPKFFRERVDVKWDDLIKT